MTKLNIKVRASQIKLLLTDCDGVLTDGGVYYTSKGEEMKKFSLRDGMGVARLREICRIETGIITGENSPIVTKRAEKLKIELLFLGIKNKREVLEQIMHEKALALHQIAYIGDDVNDSEVLQRVGLAACPADAMHGIKEIVHYHCTRNGGHDCFREFAELIIANRN